MQNSAMNQSNRGDLIILDSPLSHDLGYQTVSSLGMCHFQLMIPKVTMLIWITPAERRKDMVILE